MAKFHLTPNSVQEIIDTYDEDVIVTNREGIIIKATRISGQYYGMQPEELIGKSVYDLQSADIFSPAITPMVLEQKKKVILIQQTPSGAKVLITGIPFFNEHGEIEYVISYSYNVSELLVIQEYMKDLEFEMSKVQEELSLLRKQSLTIDGLVIESKEIVEAFEIVYRVAPLDVSVVLEGERGTGKTTMAKVIHTNSSRKNGPFIEFDCATIPISMFEKELFGEITGTTQDSTISPGSLSIAGGGTLYLKKIDRLPIHLQNKLLKTLKDGSFKPVGSEKSYPLDVRLISSTETDLYEASQSNDFIEELYFLLTIIPIHLEPIRMRKEDLCSLISNHLHHFSKKYKTTKLLSDSAFKLLLKVEWKGNIHELRNVMERIVVQSTQSTIGIDDLPPEYRLQGDDGLTDFDLDGQTLPSILEHVEMKVLESARHRYKTTTAMARILGISQPSVVRKLKKYTSPDD
ncbi:PAS domain-containing protein [Sporosarcina sp. ANT_H38]|uniref:sigma 54-interacting transcriptional regulator n=1 Tax=Sporosarcina sp. ANT_H38 TaxID=2597358 RepID=UPI0011F1A288|nr:sigma 54-interacting transcriptional regulator [Sporosarcina sp. ANT_H38]KAA0955467.1 PAS domain-containing protein [Sporosarcina sp. ANT_H38]